MRVVRAMDEREFQRLPNLFPVVPSRNYCVAASELSGGSASCAAVDEITERKDAWSQMDEKVDSIETDNDSSFWQKIRLAAERKVGAKQAGKFARMAREKLVNEELSVHAALRFADYNDH